MKIENVTIEINVAGAAFDDSPECEIARILREMADRIEAVGIPPVPRDINGNKCGQVSVKFAD